MKSQALPTLPKHLDPAIPAVRSLSVYLFNIVRDVIFFFIKKNFFEINVSNIFIELNIVKKLCQQAINIKLSISYFTVFLD